MENIGVGEAVCLCKKTRRHYVFLGKPRSMSNLVYGNVEKDHAGESMEDLILGP